MNISNTTQIDLNQTDSELVSGKCFIRNTLVKRWKTLIIIHCKINRKRKKQKVNKKCRVEMLECIIIKQY